MIGIVKTRFTPAENFQDFFRPLYGSRAFWTLNQSYFFVYTLLYGVRAHDNKYNFLDASYKGNWYLGTNSNIPDTQYIYLQSNAAFVFYLLDTFSKIRYSTLENQCSPDINSVSCASEQIQIHIQVQLHQLLLESNVKNSLEKFKYIQFLTDTLSKMSQNASNGSQEFYAEWNRQRDKARVDATTEQNGVMSPNFWGHGQI